MAFDIGQKVVYPNHGVSVVEKISSASFAGDEQTFYHLRLLSNSSKVMVPTENLELVGLRPLGTSDGIKKLFKILEDGNIDVFKDWKGRYKQNLDKMKTGELQRVAEVLKNLCLISQKKSLSFREKKMFERAKYFIVSEVAHVLDIEQGISESRVEKSLETSLQKLAKRKEREKQREKQREEEREREREKKREKEEEVAAAAKAAAREAKSGIEEAKSGIEEAKSGIEEVAEEVAAVVG